MNTPETLASTPVTLVSKPGSWVNKPGLSVNKPVKSVNMPGSSGCTPVTLASTPETWAEYAGDVGLYAGEVGEYAGDVGEYAGEVGEYPGDCPPPPPPPYSPCGENLMESSKGDMCAVGDRRNDGDMAPSRPGVMPRPGVTPTPRPPSASPRSRSTASLSTSSLRWRPNSPVPRGQNCPSMMFSDRPLMPSRSEKAAASIKMSTVSSNEHRMSGPGFNPVDAVPGDGHEVPAVGHHLDQDGEVAVVDVRAVKLDNPAELFK